MQIFDQNPELGASKTERLELEAKYNLKKRFKLRMIALCENFILPSLTMEIRHILLGFGLKQILY